MEDLLHPLNDAPRADRRVKEFPHTSLSSNIVPQPASNHTSAASSIPRSGSWQAGEISNSDMLGQFSFAPATQTTVVTTTTTTTTNFPPLRIKAPQSLHERDPKLYPLASSQTPQSLKRLCFDVGRRPTFFREADNTVEALQQLNQQHRALDASDGTISYVSTSTSGHEVPILQDSNHQANSLSSRSSIRAMRPKSRKRSASPTPIPGSTETMDRPSHRSNKKVRSTSMNTRMDAPPRQALAHSRLQICQTSTPVTPSLIHDHPCDGNKIQGQRMKRLEDFLPKPYQSDAVPEERVPSRTLSPEPDTMEESERAGSQPGFAAKRGEQTLALAGEDDIVVGKNRDIAPTPSPRGGDLPEHVPRAIRPRPSALNTAATQDMSLPSPSLSPVTAAATLRGGYFDESVLGNSSTDSSFDTLRSIPHDGTQKLSSDAMASVSPSDLSSGSAVGLIDEQTPTNHQTRIPSMMDIPTMLDSFEAMPAEMKTYVMFHLLRRCPKPVLYFVANVVNPALKIDFLASLPLELCLNVIGHLDLKSLCRAAQVSKRWRHMINSDEKAWKQLFDRDGYILPEGELQRAVQEGWGWQNASRLEDWEKDLSILSNVPLDNASNGASASPRFPVYDEEQAVEFDSPSFHNKRPKRKATIRPKPNGRKQQKRREPSMFVNEGYSADTVMDLSAAEGPYAAANAAAMAVPFPNYGLPSLKNLHLFKAIYQRHHLIRKSWMQYNVKPKHLAFRAHGRHVVTCLQFDTDKILTGSDDNKINVYDTRTGARRAILEGHEGGVWALQYVGNVLVSGSTDRSVRVWDIARGVCTQAFQGHTSTVRCLQILMPTAVGRTPDGKTIMMPKQPLIITGSRDSSLRVWKLPRPNDKIFFQAGPPQDEGDSPYFVRVLTGHHHSVRAIAAHADTLVSGSYDATVRVWKISTGETIHRLTGHTQKVYSVVLDHERNRCISGSMDNLVKVWSLDTGSLCYNLDGHSSLVGLLDLQQNRLVSAAADSTLRIWDPEFGHCKSTLVAHTGAITCFQHDGQKVISGSDRTLKMWNVTNGEFVKDLLTDLSGVWQVKFDERRCVAAVQRNNDTYIEVLDFGASRDGVSEHKRGRRTVVDSEGHEISDRNDNNADPDETPD